MAGRVFGQDPAASVEAVDRSCVLFILLPDEAVDSPEGPDLVKKGVEQVLRMVRAL